MSITSITSQNLPILENGDRVTRDEFERRYHRMSNVKKAELIEGTVYRQSPVRVTRHGRPHSWIIGWLIQYEVATPNLMVCDNTTVRLDVDNEPQPDALLRLDESVGGNSRISEDDYVEGAPELIVEIAGCRDVPWNVSTQELVPQSIKPLLSIWVKFNYQARLTME